MKTMQVNKKTRTITAEHWERCVVANYLSKVVPQKEMGMWSVHFVQKSPIEAVKKSGR